ncbi:MAG: HAD-IA family hydrolase, partial [Gammaproteobacteria bacterium]|nr:HAD-IA family hydrolase [Gammaproteobacteria bacterium]
FGADLMLHDAIRLRHEYLELYADNIHIHSRVFKGFERVQSAFDHHNIPWGIVTNKPAFLSNSLLEKIPGLEQSRCLIAADSMPLRKPHACGLLLGAAEIGVAPWHCAYIGDSRRDIQAAQHARMHSVAATYGYIKDDDDHRSWGADCFIDALPELSDIVKP